MTVSITSTSSVASDDNAGAGVAYRRAAIALLVVGVLYLVLQNVLMSRPLGLSTDEADYLAKVNPSVPELYWTQVRAWGTPVLAAPVALFSPSTEAVRLYFSVLSSIAVVAAFWPWRRLLHPAVAPLAALLFTTTWFATLFGLLVMPNLYVGLGAVATTGLFLRAVQTSSMWRTGLAGLAAGFVALVRPTDSVLLLVPIFACALLIPRLRRFDVLAALAIGDLLGWLPWVIEAYQRFGGPLARLTAGNEGGLHGGVALNLVNLLTYPRMLDGSPNYCCYGAPAAKAGHLPLLLTIWFVAIPVFAVLGCVVSRRRGQLPEMLLVALPAAMFSVFYIFLLEFANVRFLLPIWALLAVPVATGLVFLVRSSRGFRLVPGALVSAAVLGHLALMLVTSAHVFPDKARQRATNVKQAALLRPLVPTHPCIVLVPVEPSVLSYYLGCSPAELFPTAQPPARVTTARRKGAIVVALTNRPPTPGSYLAGWRRVPLPQLGRTWAAYLAP